MQADDPRPSPRLRELTERAMAAAANRAAIEAAAPEVLADLPEIRRSPDIIAACWASAGSGP